MARLFLRGYDDDSVTSKRGRRWGDIVVYRTEKWGWIARRVPRSSPKSRRAISKWSEWLRVANILWKYSHPQLRKDLALTEQLSGYPARDWFLSGLGGLLFILETDDGRTVYSMSHVVRFSRTLDVFGQRPGSILVRGREYWSALPPGAPGQVLAVSGGGMPEWSHAGGAAAGVWVNALCVNGRWGLTFEDQSRVQYREVRSSGEDWVSCAVPRLWEGTVGTAAHFRTMGAGEGGVRLRFSVYGGGVENGVVLLASVSETIIPPGVDGRYFVFQCSVALPEQAARCTLLILELRRLGDHPEDTYPRALGFLGMMVSGV